VPDSICYPAQSQTSYPYNADGTREFIEDKPFIDPFVLAASLGALTRRISFNFFVLKLPIRHPVLVAKQAASVVALIGDRLRLGVGLSPWPEDFAVTGTEWKRRGARMDEMIEIMRGLLAGGFFEHRGEFYEIPRIKLCPVPAQPLPILIGGHADAALRRAARLGDGWMHAGGGREDLGDLLARLAHYRREAGRDRAPFEIHVGSVEAYTPDGVRRLEERGVTDVLVGVRNAYEPDRLSLEQKLEGLKRFADQVIGRLS
jgi:alkanesulfonate monooxygenase SsuD/methylene tetrahydromethanopterin reductase-like flavin-dependent oxidoreductase (luciferase family)